MGVTDEMSRYPELVQFHFRATSKADKDRKLQWLMRCLRLDDKDWQLIIDLLGGAKDIDESDEAAAILDRLDVEITPKPTKKEVITATRRRIAEAGFAAVRTTDGPAWSKRIGDYRIWICAVVGDPLGEHPDDPYFFRVSPYNRITGLVQEAVDDLAEALGYAADCEKDPQGWVVVKEAA